MLLVFIDTYSNWVEAIPMGSNLTALMIQLQKCLHSLFAYIVSDNGPQWIYTVTYVPLPVCYREATKINAVFSFFSETIRSLNTWLSVKEVQFPPLSNVSLHRKPCALCKLQEAVKPKSSEGYHWEWVNLEVRNTSSHTFILHSGHRSVVHW